MAIIKKSLSDKAPVAKTIKTRSAKSSTTTAATPQKIKTTMMRYM